MAATLLPCIPHIQPLVRFIYIINAASLQLLIVDIFISSDHTLHIIISLRHCTTSIWLAAIRQVLPMVRLRVTSCPFVHRLDASVGHFKLLLSIEHEQSFDRFNR